MIPEAPPELGGESHSLGLWVGKHSPEKATFEVGPEGGRGEKGQLPIRQEASWENAAAVQAHVRAPEPALALGTVRRSILPPPW